MTTIAILVIVITTIICLLNVLTLVRNQIVFTIRTRMIKDHSLMAYKLLPSYNEMILEITKWTNTCAGGCDKIKGCCGTLNDDCCTEENSDDAECGENLICVDDFCKDIVAKESELLARFEEEHGFPYPLPIKASL